MEKASGVIFLHTVPVAAGQYVEKIISDVLKVRLEIDWQQQKASTSSNLMRATINWIGDAETAPKLASALRGWEHLRYEITQNPSGNIEGARWMHTPSLGIFYQMIDNAGNALIPEQRIRTVIETGGNLSEIRQKLDLALGTAWDSELEPFRMSDENIKWIF